MNQQADIKHQERADSLILRNPLLLAVYDYALLSTYPITEENTRRTIELAEKIANLYATEVRE